MVRRPQTVNRSCNHLGEGPIFIPLIILAEYLGQALESVISISRYDLLFLLRGI